MTIINIHMSPPPEQGERFDTLISPAGSIAALEKIQIDNKLQEEGFDLAQIDEANFIGGKINYDGQEMDFEETVEYIINKDKKENKPTFLFFSVLIYNSERTIKYINELKKKHGDQIKIVVGGQLVPFAENAFLNNGNIDTTCLGDAELIIPQFFQDYKSGQIKKRYERWIAKEFTEGQRFYSSMSYKYSIGLKERLERQLKSHPADEEKGFTQICLQGSGGPGCSWAAHNPSGPCKFCALQNITAMNNVSPEATVANELRVTSEIRESTGIDVDRMFYVDNLFFPEFSMQEKKVWIKRYVSAMRDKGIKNKKYIYLTVGSIDEEIVGMLKDIGVEEVYLGIDHFDKEALIAQNKPARNEKAIFNTLDALRNAGIKFRAGIVLGAVKETESTLQKIREGVTKIADNYKDIIRTIGVFPVEIIPGSQVWDDMRFAGLCQDIFEKFENLGYLSREEQHELTKKYIEHFSETSYENVMSLREEIRQILKDRGVLEYEVDRQEKARTELERFEKFGGGKLQK